MSEARVPLDTGAPTIVGVSEINQVADPAPLGLGGFAATTFALSMVNAGVISERVAPMVLPLMLIYGGVTQLLAGMWEFRNNRNTFGAVAFTSYGAFWLSLWALNTQVLDKDAIPAGDVPQAVGVFLLAWTIFTFYMWIGSFRLNWALVGVFTALLVTFILLVIGEWASKPTIVKLGGWTGIVTAVIAWYTAAAVVVNHTFKRTVIPVFPIS
jgi:succinate-acetate transporter protein